jgi:arsenate reductase
MTAPRHRILILCTGNSCRSQMTEAYIRDLAGDRVEVFSAGIEAHGLHPWAVATMLEEGIDISGQRSKTLDAFKGQSFDHVITVCDNAKETCPWFPADAERLHYAFPDPARVQGTPEQIAEEFRRVRRMIKAYCTSFVRKLE